MEINQENIAYLRQMYGILEQVIDQKLTMDCPEFTSHFKRIMPEIISRQYRCNPTCASCCIMRAKELKNEVGKLLSSIEVVNFVPPENIVPDLEQVVEIIAEPKPKPKPKIFYSDEKISRVKKGRIIIVKPANKKPID